jgi:hypothetical protein
MFYLKWVISRPLGVLAKHSCPPGFLDLMIHSSWPGALVYGSFGNPTVAQTFCYFGYQLLQYLYTNYYAIQVVASAWGSPAFRLITPESQAAG